MNSSEKRSLRSCQSEEEWNAACDAIKKDHGGEYPEEWYDEVILSGMADVIMSRWGGNTKIRISTLDKLPEIEK